jgi:hypothetical protein
VLIPKEGGAPVAKRAVRGPVAQRGDRRWGKKSALSSPIGAVDPIAAVPYRPRPSQRLSQTEGLSIFSQARCSLAKHLARPQKRPERQWHSIG